MPLKVPANPNALTELRTSLPERAPLPEALKAIKPKLKRLVTKQRSDFLKTNFKIGLIAQKGIDAHVATHGSSYGSGLVDQLAEEAGMAPRVLRYCLNVVDTFSSEEYDNLIAHVGVNWGHVVHLLAVDQKMERQHFLEQTVANEWTSDQLAGAIAEKYGKRGHSTGRKPSAPGNLKQAFMKLEAGTKKFQNTLHYALFGDEFDLPTVLSETPPDSVNADLRFKTEQSAIALEAIAQLAMGNVRRLRDQLLWIDEVLSPDGESDEGSEHG